MAEPIISRPASVRDFSITLIRSNREAAIRACVIELLTQAEERLFRAEYADAWEIIGRIKQALGACVAGNNELQDAETRRVGALSVELKRRDEQQGHAK